MQETTEIYSNKIIKFRDAITCTPHTQKERKNTVIKDDVKVRCGIFHQFSIPLLYGVLDELESSKSSNNSHNSNNSNSSKSSKSPRSPRSPRSEARVTRVTRGTRGTVECRPLSIPPFHPRISFVHFLVLCVSTQLEMLK